MHHARCTQNTWRNHTRTDLKVSALSISPHGIQRCLQAANREEQSMVLSNYKTYKLQQWATCWDIPNSATVARTSGRKITAVFLCYRPTQLERTYAWSCSLDNYPWLLKSWILEKTILLPLYWTGELSHCITDKCHSNTSSYFFLQQVETITEIHI